MQLWCSTFTILVLNFGRIVRILTGKVLVNEKVLNFIRARIIVTKITPIYPYIHHL